MNKQGSPLFSFLGKLIIKFHELRKINPWRKEIILIDKTDGLGDIIMWLPYAQKLRECFPKEKYRLNILVYSRNTNLIEAALFDRVISVPPYKNALQWALFRLSFWLRNPMDQLIAFHYSFSKLLSPYNPETAISFRHSKIQNLPIGKNRITFPADDLSVAERFPMLLKALGCADVSPVPFDYRKLILPPPAECPDSHFIVISPGANSPLRQWEPEKFSTIANELIRQYHYKIVLVGSPKEKSICRKIYDACADKEFMIDLSGKTSVHQLFGMISKADFLLSNETGTAHIGGVLGIKTFIISGGGDYGDFVPYPAGKEGKTVFSIFCGDHHCFRCLWQNQQCISSGRTAPCISNITAAQVMKRIKEVMQNP